MNGAVAEHDRRLVAVASKIRVLGALSFPEDAALDFLHSWRKGDPLVPELPDIRPVAEERVEALRDIVARVDRGDPLGRFVHDTAASYLKCAALIAQPATPTFHRLSRDLYGTPTESMVGTTRSHLDAADRLLDVTADVTAATADLEVDYCLTAEHVAAELRRRIEQFFVDDEVAVVIDPNLSSKAAASATRVRLRGRTAFSEMDVAQLAEHELYVHSATSLNGRKQTHLQSLGLGAPRTTATQEGLATFAELVTGAIDLARLRRLAQRIRAIHLAEEGADFVEVFRYFLEAGQTEMESVYSTLRVFRGGDMRGRHVFTKDVVYLRGLIAVHTFLHKAISRVRPELVPRLFCGRLALGDTLALEEAFADGRIAAPYYLPAWARNLRALAAFLSFSLVLNDIDLRSARIDDLLDSPSG